MKAVLINTTSEIGHHGCTLVCRRIEELAAEAGIEIASWLPLKTQSADMDWSGFDLAILNGEGSLHHDRPAAFQIANFGAAFAMMGKPAYLINSVYQDNCAEIADGVRQFRRVWARESMSAGELAEAGIAATVVPDLSLSWSGDDLTHTGGRPVVIDAVSPRENRELFGFAEKLRAPFFSLMTHPPRIPTFPDENLKRIAKYKWRRLTAHFRLSAAKRAKALNQFPDFESFTRWLASNAGIIVTGRFHAVCIALDMEIPVLALPSNTHKIEGMLADAGIENRVIDDLDAVLFRLQDKTCPAFSYSDHELDLMRKYRARALHEARQMFADIAQDCAG